MTVWGLGNFIVIYLAGLQGIPKSYLEAVEIDGGNAWHKFRHVTLPLMSPIIFFNVLMSIVVEPAGLRARAVAHAGRTEQLDALHGLLHLPGGLQNGTASATPPRCP